MKKENIVIRVLLILVLSLFASAYLISPITTNLIQSEAEESPVVNAIYFFSFDCPHCQAVKTELLAEMESQYGDQINILYIEISSAKNYEMLITFEEVYGVSAADRGIPTLVIGDTILIGEDDIRSDFSGLVEDNLTSGVDWPVVDGFNAADFDTDPFGDSDFVDDAYCGIEEETCDVDSPIYIAYFYQTGCKVCSRVEADINYLQTKYPQVIVDEFNIYDNVDLGQWLAQKAGRDEDVSTPAIFIGDTMLMGEEEITPQSIEELILANQDGAEKIWNNFDGSSGAANTIFENLSWLTIAIAGLIDGLNPCAFATLIFFVSYLSLSNRKGKEILMVGGAFAVGVFIAYLVVGLGFYQVLDLLGGVLQVLSNIVYGITAVFCLTLAVLSIRDAIKVRRGGTADMELHLPEKLRKRINSRIREGRNASAYVWFAFITGIIISMLELACTGQIYLPTIIFMTSQENMQVQAIFYLILYNLMFIIPLIIVFILAYYGTNSKDLTKFLEKHATKIKVGMSILFAALGVWLLYSIFK